MQFVTDGARQRRVLARPVRAATVEFRGEPADVPVMCDTVLGEISKAEVVHGAAGLRIRAGGGAGCGATAAVHHSGAGGAVPTDAAYGEVSAVPAPGLPVHGGTGPDGVPHHGLSRHVEAVRALGAPAEVTETEKAR